MLPPAIRGQTLETEVCIHTKSEFSSDTVKAQVQEIKYERDKQLSSARSHLSLFSNHGGRSAPNSVRMRPQPQPVPKLPLVRADEDDDDTSG